MQLTSSNRLFDGWQQRYRHQSSVLNCDMKFSVYLPPQAEESVVPVLYWLSGLTCTDQNFVTKAGAQQFAAEFGMALVAPDTSPRGADVPDDPNGDWDFGLGAGFYLNATQQPWAEHYRMYDYVVRELPALLKESALPLNLDQQSISGHSMGGHGALVIGLKNPQHYRSISAFSPIVAPSQVPWGQKAFLNYLGDDRSGWAEYDSCELIRRSDRDARLAILVDQGEADEFREQQLRTERLIEAAEAAQYPMRIRFQPDYDHSYYFIASFIRDHIEFHSNFLKS